jgi:hypothetical protein
MGLPKVLQGITAINTRDATEGAFLKLLIF